MSNPMEGRKMDPKLAGILAKHATPHTGDKLPTEAANDPNASETPVVEQPVSEFEKMVPLLAKKKARSEKKEIDTNTFWWNK